MQEGMSITDGLITTILNRACSVAIAIGAFALIGCQVSTSDAPKPVDSFKLSGPQSNCLAEAAPTIQAYFQGKGKPDDVAGVWDCASQALDMFTQYTRGGTADVYTAKEIRSFLETYFLGDVRVSDEMLTEVMRLKQTILGGSIDTITRTEIARTQGILKTLRTETLRTLPYMDIITLRATVEDAQRDSQRVESAIIAFNTTMENLGGLLGQSNQVYELRYLENLMDELQKIYSTGNRHWDGPEFVIKNLSTIAALKGFIIKPAPDKIQPDEWQPLLVNSGRLFALYMRANYLLKSRDLLNGEGLDQLSVALYDLFDIIQGAIQAKPNKIIDYAQVDSLVDEIMRTGYFNLTMRPSTMKSLAHVAFEKVFNTPVNGVRAPVSGLTMPVFTNARDGIFGWLDMQRVWRELQNTAVERDPSLKGKPIPLKVIKELWPKIRTPFRSAHADLNNLFNRKFPLVLTDAGTVLFDPQAGDKFGYGQEAFDALNWRSQFARVVSLGWVQNPTDPFKGLTKPEFEAFFYDARPLAIDLKFVNPDDTKIWDTSFDESNMFMLAGDANNYLSFGEGVDFIAYAMSSSHILDPVYDDVTANCAHEGFDAYNRPLTNIDCFNDRTSASFVQTFKSIPTWATLAQSIGPAKTRALLVSLEAGARSSAKPSDPMGISDINRVVMLVHYIESI